MRTLYFVYMADQPTGPAQKRRSFLNAEWRDLAMLNYEVDPSLLREFVPYGTEIDSWNGKIFASLVGFRFLNTRVSGISLPFHRNFDEVNLRFYVRRAEGGQVKRGVVFIREIVPRRLIASIARIFYNERYIALPMSHEIRDDGACRAIQYCWRTNNSQNAIRVRTVGAPVLPDANSQEQFITEHYWGYAAQRDGGCIEYEVEHPPWKVWNAVEASFEGDMEQWYGKELNDLLAKPPVSAFVAEGSPVVVYRGRRLL